MSGLDKNKLSQQRVIVERMAGFLWVQSSVVLFLAAIGIFQVIVKHFTLAAGALVAAAALALIVISFWKQHRTVKAGTAAYAVLSQPQFQMPQIVSLVIVLFVTAFVGVCSAFILYVVNLYFRTQMGWAVCGSTLLAVWLFVAYCWYRVLSEKPRLPATPIYEQPEGVWPPAPLVAAEDNNED